jgi:hypothetical protein
MHVGVTFPAVTVCAATQFAVVPVPPDIWAHLLRAEPTRVPAMQLMWHEDSLALPMAAVVYPGGQSMQSALAFGRGEVTLYVPR